MLEPGQIVSHYRILECLGKGAMGVVYGARDLKLDRPVALKFLSPSLSRTHFERERLLSEARTASKLNHPGICVIYDVEELESSETFIAMELVVGSTLARRINKRPMSNDLLRSTDGGTTRVSVGHGLEGVYIPTVYVVQLAPLGGASLLALNESNGLFRSNDNGASWARGKITGPAFYGSLTSIAGDGNMALAGSDESNVAYCSTDGGANWRDEWTGIPWGILAAEVVGTTLLLGTDHGGSFRSAGAGARWYPANNGMPGAQWYGEVTWNVNAFARSGTHLFVGTTIGVYMSSDTGGTWVPVNAGLGTGTTNVLSLAVLGTDLYAGTEGISS